VTIADAEGLAALSMRKVANHLGVGAMSLYTYVPGRSELVELMIDRVYGEHTIPKADLPWRRRVEQWARETWRIYNAHPWLLDYNMARLPIGPHVLDVSEVLYTALRDAGFAGAENVAIFNLINWQLLGAARSMISDADEARHTGVSCRGVLGIPAPASGRPTSIGIVTPPWPPSGRQAGSTIRPAGISTACSIDC
jgi:AcrR family transcriptional regulator